MKEKLRRFWKNQTVLCIAGLLAAASMLFVPPSRSYIGYINANTLILLFVLMGAVGGLRICGVFQRLAEFLTKKCSHTRILALVMLSVCFFSAMFITNDVALLTFVPVTLLIYSGKTDADSQKSMILTVILETAAANLGSMMLPTGNPQNIYLCSYYLLSLPDLVRTLFPYGIIAFTLLCISVLILPKQSLTIQSNTESQSGTFSWLTTFCCSIVFVLALLTVSGVLNGYICLGVSSALLLLANIRIFAKIDYFLLLTFVCFFIFTGNLGNIAAVRNLLSDLMNGRELLISILASQIFSNVPAAILLSGFTQKASALLIGVNLGGLGTPIASLASLISFQLFSRECAAKSGQYMKMFFLFNFAFLSILCVFAWILT